jgi:hypothetical protein
MTANAEPSPRLTAIRRDRRRSPKHTPGSKAKIRLR